MKSIVLSETNKTISKRSNSQHTHTQKISYQSLSLVQKA